MTREKLTKPSELFENEKTVQVTKRNKPVYAILSWEFYESLIETLEVLSDKQIMKAIRKFEKEKSNGSLKLISIDKIQI